jgi:hypothetical protein
LACAVTELFLIGLFVTGALVSIHRFLPILTLLLAAGILYLLQCA